jgi:hypothetical protein
MVKRAAEEAEAAAKALVGAAPQTAATSAAAAAIRKLLRMRNKRGETALCQAVRAASEASINMLMSWDPDLACFPREGEEGASPMYVAIFLGKMDIGRLLFETSRGRLSYSSGPDGRNVLHEAISREGTYVLRLVHPTCID